MNIKTGHVVLEGSREEKRLKTRIITAVVALIFFIPFVVYGGIPFELLSILLATIALYEVLVMTKQRIFFDEWNNYFTINVVSCRAR